MKKFLIWSGVFGAAFAAAIASCALHGWVLSVLWGWFVVPLGLPRITVAHAYGLLVIATLIARRESLRPTKEARERSDWGDAAVRAGTTMVVLPLMLLLLGYLTKGLM